MPEQRRPRTRQSTPRWQRRPAARPEELLEAALAVFSEYGFARARLEDVGRRAGVSKGTVYLYFDSKEALFRALVQAKVGTAVTTGEQFVRAFQGPTRQLLVTFIHRYWATMLEPTNARLARLVVAELGNFPELTKFYMDEVVLRVHRVITTIIERGVARGEFRPVSPLLAARALQGLCVHLAQWQHALRAYDSTPLSDEHVVAGIVDLFLHGLLAAREAAPPGG